jgi:hypothetical protein
MGSTGPMSTEEQEAIQLQMEEEERKKADAKALADFKKKMKDSLTSILQVNKSATFKNGDWTINEESREGSLFSFAKNKDGKLKTLTVVESELGYVVKGSPGKAARIAKQLLESLGNSHGLEAEITAGSKQQAEEYFKKMHAKGIFNDDKLDVLLTYKENGEKKTVKLTSEMKQTIVGVAKPKDPSDAVSPSIKVGPTAKS